MPPHYGRGYRFYNAFQQTFFANLLYQNQDSERHHFTLGVSEMLDIWSEAFNVDCYTGPTLSDTGAFGEYTFRDGDRFSAIVGLRGDYYNAGGFRFSPRLTLKWAPSDEWVFRGNAGRGIRYSTPLVDNFGVLSSSKPLSGDFQSHPLEDSWTFGANATWYMPFDDSGKPYLSADWFYTTFTSQMLYSHEDAVIGTYAGKPVHGDVISFYELGSLVGDNYSYTNNFQLDFSTEPFRGFTATLTGRITDARQTLKGQSDDVKPMTSLYKGVLNLQYAARLNKWIFDFTASVNGPCRVWDFMKDITVDGEKIYADGYTPVYPLLYAQVTKRFKGVDVYVGGENLTGYTQPMPIISADDPFGSNFDASCVWGPVMGLKLYAGVRFTLWKK